MGVAYLVHDTVLGSATARPIHRWGEAPDAAAAAAQAFNANEAAVLIGTLIDFEGAANDDELTATYDFTFNTATQIITAASQAADTSMLAARARLRITREIAESDEWMTGERKISNGRFTAWLTYRNDLRAVPSQGGYPTSIVWPTKPSLTDDDTIIQSDRVYKRINIIGAVAQLAGVPLGAIFQSGSNANGEYVYVADGLLICWRTITLGAPNTANGSMFVTPDATWTYPAIYVSAPNVFGMGNSTYLGVVRGSGAIGVTTAVLAGIRPGSSGTSMSGLVCAIGRWY